MVFVKNRDLVYMAASQAFSEMVGKGSAEEIVGRTDFDIFENPELAKRYTDDDHRLFAIGNDMVSYVEPLTDDNGQPRYSSTSKYILRDKEGNMIGVLGISRDITREYMTRQRHQQELRYLFELPEDTYAALFMDIDDWRIISHHRQSVGEYTIPLCETMDDFAENAVYCIEEDESSEAVVFFKNLSKESMLELCSGGARNYTIEYKRRMPGGEKIWVRVDIHFLIDPENSHLCAIWSLKDINVEKQEAISLHHAAEHDEMTGLFNRAYTIRSIQKTLKEGSSLRHALFMIDVDNFKSLNDTLGHQVGDEFLITLSEIFRSCFRETDIVGRVGGDEFFILMKDIPSKMIVYEKAETLMGLSSLLCSRYPDLDISISIGISIFPIDGKELDVLYDKADKALYLAKKRGKNQFVFSTGSRAIPRSTIF